VTECSFCHGKAVLNAAHLVDDTQPRYAACPRCGKRVRDTRPPGGWRTVECPHCGRVMRPNALPKHVRTHSDDQRLRMVVPMADQEAMMRFYRKGWSLARIAAETLWSPGTVARVRDLWGEPRRQRGGRRPYLPADDVLATAELYGRGYSLRRVAELLGLNPETVRTRLVRADVQRRPAGGTTLRGTPRDEWAVSRASSGAARSGGAGVRARARRPRSVPPRAPQRPSGSSS
jgi:DNA-directed RNA polymerase subunit RPC12/RpoP